MSWPVSTPPSSVILPSASKLVALLVMKLALLSIYIGSAYGSRTQFSRFASLRDFAANTRLNCSYLRRGKNAALLFSCRITKFPCPNLSEMPRARAIVVTKRRVCSVGMACNHPIARRIARELRVGRTIGKTHRAIPSRLHVLSNDDNSVRVMLPSFPDGASTSLSALTVQIICPLD